MLKILIAEDDRELRQLFQHVLTKNGYAVHCVSNGREALDALDRIFYDLLISDIMMPEMDGYELVRQLRDAGSTTPIMMPDWRVGRGADRHAARSGKRLRSSSWRWLPRRWRAESLHRGIYHS